MKLKDLLVDILRGDEKVIRCEMRGDRVLAPQHHQVLPVSWHCSSSMNVVIRSISLGGHEY